MSTHSVLLPPTVKWREGQRHEATVGDVSVTVYPSTEHPGFWYTRKISFQGGMEEFIRPARLSLVEHFIFRTEPSLPQNVVWQIGNNKEPERRRETPSPLRANCVYFIEAVDLQRVKIGYTSDRAESRLSALQTGCPVRLRVLAQIKGDAESERLLHEQFSHLRLHGEWFKLERDLLEYVQGLQGGQE